MINVFDEEAIAILKETRMAVQECHNGSTSDRKTIIQVGKDYKEKKEAYHKKQGRLADLPDFKIISRKTNDIKLATYVVEDDSFKRLDNGNYRPYLAVEQYVPVAKDIISKHPNFTSISEVRDEASKEWYIRSAEFMFLRRIRVPQEFVADSNGGNASLTADTAVETTEVLDEVDTNTNAASIVPAARNVAPVAGNSSQLITAIDHAKTCGVPVQFVQVTSGANYFAGGQTLVAAGATINHNNAPGISPKSLKAAVKEAAFDGARKGGFEGAVAGTLCTPYARP